MALQGQWPRNAAGRGRNTRKKKGRRGGGCELSAPTLPPENKGQGRGDNEISADARSWVGRVTARRLSAGPRALVLTRYVRQPRAANPGRTYELPGVTGNAARRPTTSERCCQELIDVPVQSPKHPNICWARIGRRTQKVRQELPQGLIVPFLCHRSPRYLCG